MPGGTAVKSVECAREADALAAIARGWWPDRADEELRSHVAGCAACGQVVAVAAPLQEAREITFRSASVPPASLLWWKAQMRARREADVRASRPIALMLAVAFAGLLAAVLVAARFTVAWLPAWLDGVGKLVPDVSITLPDAAVFAAVTRSSLILALAAWLVLAPIAIYFAVAKDREN
jgi:hypothetical protein